METKLVYANTRKQPCFPGADADQTVAGDHHSVKIKYEDYKRIMNVLIHRLRKLEEDAEAAAETETSPKDSGQFFCYLNFVLVENPSIET